MFAVKNGSGERRLRRAGVAIARCVRQLVERRFVQLFGRRKSVPVAGWANCRLAACAPDYKERAPVVEV